MPKLTAKYTINIQAQCLIQWPEAEPIFFSYSLGEFEITVVPVIPWHSKSKSKDDLHWTTTIDKIEIHVTRNEESMPPVVIPNSKGGMDYSIQTTYFDSIIRAYEDVARETANRFIRFFKYKLCTPRIREIPVGHQSVKNPQWTDKNGVSVGYSTQEHLAQRTRGLYGACGVLKLNNSNISQFSDFLNNPSPITLVDELLSDAQTAWFDGNLRRSVLELAIACEVIAKRRFFSGDSPAGIAFDYIEDKTRVSIRVVDLIDSVCKEAFSRSFNDEHPTDYNNIVNLFQCRNKIAHRGELTYRNKKGLKIDANASIVEQWWYSVVKLREWLDTVSVSSSD